MHYCNLPYFPCSQIMANQVDAEMMPDMFPAYILNIHLGFKSIAQVIRNGCH